MVGYLTHRHDTWGTPRGGRSLAVLGFSSRPSAEFRASDRRMTSMSGQGVGLCPPWLSYVVFEAYGAGQDFRVEL
jgi:hypothetical protein